ncbi:MAG: hypothetical protein KDC38_00415 [Planctomycetes bacterium]|nr:hypothetical protein [Planctomycetota bacterium]
MEERRPPVSTESAPVLLAAVLPVNTGSFAVDPTYFGPILQGSAGLPDPADPMPIVIGTLYDVRSKSMFRTTFRWWRTAGGSSLDDTAGSEDSRSATSMAFPSAATTGYT